MVTDQSGHSKGASGQHLKSLAAAVGFWIYPGTTKIQTYVSIVHEEALTLQDAKYSD